MLNLENRARIPEIRVGKSHLRDLLPGNWMNPEEMAFPIARIITPKEFNEVYLDPQFSLENAMYLKFGLTLTHHGFETRLRFPFNLDPVNHPLEQQDLERALIKVGEGDAKYFVIERIKHDPTHTIVARPVFSPLIGERGVHIPASETDPRGITISVDEEKYLVVSTTIKLNDGSYLKFPYTQVAQNMLNYWLS